MTSLARRVFVLNKDSEVEDNILWLPRTTLSLLLDYAYANASEEVCGYIDGWGSLHGVANEAEMPDLEYVMDAEEQMRVIQLIEGCEIAIAAEFHTHAIGGSKPSLTDEQSWSRSAAEVSLIWSNERAELRAYENATGRRLRLHVYAS